MEHDVVEVGPRCMHLDSGSSLDRYTCRREINAATTTPGFYKDRGLGHLPK